MRYFPIFLDLEGQRAVIIGGAEEAARKIRLLARTGAEIAVVAEALDDEIAANPRVVWLARRFEPRHLDGAALAVCAERELNAAVFAAARARNIPVNAVDDAARSTFLIPSIVDRDPVVVAIGTEGAAPVLGQSLRARIDALLPAELGALTRQAAALRQRVAAALPGGPRRRSFWSRFFAGPQDGPLPWAQVEALLADDAPDAAGTVTFIAVPEGEVDLLTLRAQRRLMQADLIVHDANGVAAALEMARRDCQRSAATQDQTERLAREARMGKAIVRLTADTLPLSEIQALERMSIPVECLGTTLPAPAATLHHDLYRAAS